MVLGGYNSIGGELSDVEIVDLSSSEPFCFKPASYPAPVLGAFAEVISDQVTVCGGHSEETGLSNSGCFEYNTISDEWVEKSARMIEHRFQPGAVLVEGGDWWFTGKKDLQLRSCVDYFNM